MHTRGEELPTNYQYCVGPIVPESLTLTVSITRGWWEIEMNRVFSIYKYSTLFLWLVQALPYDSTFWRGYILACRKHHRRQQSRPVARQEDGEVAWKTEGAGFAGPLCVSVAHVTTGRREHTLQVSSPSWPVACPRRQRARVLHHGRSAEIGRGVLRVQVYDYFLRATNYLELNARSDSR